MRQLIENFTRHIFHVSSSEENLEVQSLIQVNLSLLDESRELVGDGLCVTKEKVEVVSFISSPKTLRKFADDLEKAAQRSEDLVEATLNEEQLEKLKYEEAMEGGKA